VRVFFDTNVLVSAFLARGLCADLLRLVLTEHTLVGSEVVLDGLRDVLRRKGRLAPAQIEAIRPSCAINRSQQGQRQPCNWGWWMPMMNGCWPVPSWSKLICSSQAIEAF
jgi:hypothetical protein